MAPKRKSSEKCKEPLVLEENDRAKFVSFEVKKIFEKDT